MDKADALTRPDDRDHVVVLTSADPTRHFRKVHMMGKDGITTTPFDMPYLVRSERFDVASVYDLGDVVEAIRRKDNAAIIRGSVIDGTPQPMRRLLHPQGETPPTIEEAPRAWMMVDIDKLLVPDWFVIPDLFFVRWVRQQLPEWLADVTCHYAWSSSAGIGGWGKVKIHLYFWLDRKIHSGAVKVWAETQPDLVDRSIYNPVHLHFETLPLFSGCEDPFEVLDCPRSGLCPGDSEFAVFPPEFETQFETENIGEVQRGDKVAWIPVESENYTPYITKAIGAIIEDLRSASEGNRHAAAVYGARSLAAFVEWGWISEAEMRVIMSNSALPSTRGREQEVDKVIAYFLGQPTQIPRPNLRASFKKRVSAGAPSASAAPRRPDPPPSSLPAPIPGLDFDPDGDTTQALMEPRRTTRPAASGQGPGADDDQQPDAGTPPAPESPAGHEEIDLDLGLDVVDPGNFPDCDLDLAARLVRRVGDQIRWNGSQDWIVYDGKVWVRDEKGARALRLAAESAAALRQEIIFSWPWGFEDKTEEKRWKGAASFAKSACNSGRLDAAVKVSRSREELWFKTEDLDADRNLLNCNSGMIDLRTGEVRPHDPMDMSTCIVELDYKPEAKCPSWDRFLLEIMGIVDDDEESVERAHRMVDFIQRMIGYTLTGHTKEQVFFLLTGDGSNGKSTFLNVMKSITGSYGQAAQMSTFADSSRNNDTRNDIATLCGSRFVSVAEPSKGTPLNEGLMKEMTGDDPIRARFLYKESFQFEPTFKIYISCNRLPRITGTDFGIWRRVRVLQFDRQWRVKPDDPEDWPEADRELPSRLAAEIDGIFAWAVRGAMRWHKEGLEPPQEVTIASNKYKSDMDTMSSFIEDECDISPHAQVRTGDLYAAYKAWAERNGHKPMSARSMGKRLSPRPELTSDRNSSGQRVWKGIQLKDEDEGIGW